MSGNSSVTRRDLLLAGAAGSFVLASSTYRGHTADPPPNIVINDASIVEGDSGYKLMVFTVSLSGASEKPIAVNYAGFVAAGLSSAVNREVITEVASEGRDLLRRIGEADALRRWGPLCEREPGPPCARRASPSPAVSPRAPASRSSQRCASAAASAGSKMA